jgi:hypothetical protein
MGIPEAELIGLDRAIKALQNPATEELYLTEPSDSYLSL